MRINPCRPKYSPRMSSSGPASSLFPSLSTILCSSAKRNQSSTAKMNQITKAVSGAASKTNVNAVVVSSGLMEKTVKVRIGVQKWNNHIRKVCSLHATPSSLPPPFLLPSAVKWQQDLADARARISQKPNTSSCTTRAPPSAPAT